MKKLLVMALSALMVLSLVACGGAASSAPASKPASSAPASMPASSMPASSMPASESAVASEEEMGYTLDYDAIAEVITTGYIGVAESGELVLLGFDGTMENAILMYVDSETYEAASFLGASIDNGDGTITIQDETNGLEITFGVTEVDEITYDLDVGDIGMIQVVEAELPEFLETLQEVITDYAFVV